MDQIPRKQALRTALSCALLIGLAAGSVLAAPNDHSGIVLKDYQGSAITKNADGSAKAYSVKTTCFGATGCHGGANAPGKAAYSYDQIESHNYHAQLGANEYKGFNPYNPDAYNPYTNVGDKWRVGAGPVGKNWVQSSGHLGSW
jgi:hypothetical protein